MFVYVHIVYVPEFMYLLEALTDLHWNYLFALIYANKHEHKLGSTVCSVCVCVCVYICVGERQCNSKFL